VSQTAANKMCKHGSKQHVYASDNRQLELWVKRQQTRCVCFRQ